MEFTGSVDMSDLAVCMIVRDEEETLGSAIESVSGIADEIIVADTGSSDRSADIARSKGAMVVNLLWMDDFAKARNTVKSMAKSPWILSLDGDEVLSSSDASKVSAWLASPEASKHKAVMLEKRSYVASSAPQYGLHLCGGQYQEELDYKAYLSEPNLLLLANSPEVKWAGAVHETVAGSISDSMGSIGSLDVVIHNYGRERHRGRKQSTYPAMVQKRLNDDPGDPTSWFYMGLLQDSRGEHQEAQESYSNSLRLEKAAHTIYALGSSLMRVGNYKSAEVEFVEYLRYRPSDNNAWMALLLCSMDRDDMDCLDYYLSNALKANTERPKDLVRFAQYIARKKDYHSKAEFYERLLEKTTNT